MISVVNVGNADAQVSAEGDIYRESSCPLPQLPETSGSDSKAYFSGLEDLILGLPDTWPPKCQPSAIDWTHTQAVNKGGKGTLLVVGPLPHIGLNGPEGIAIFDPACERAYFMGCVHFRDEVGETRRLRFCAVLAENAWIPCDENNAEDPTS